MAFKMKGFHYSGKSPVKRMKGKPEGKDGRAYDQPFAKYDSSFKQEKTLEDYLNEGFTPEDADEMMKHGATTGYPEETEIKNDDMAYLKELEAKEKAGPKPPNAKGITKAEQSALDRLRSEQGELEK